MSFVFAVLTVVVSQTGLLPVKESAVAEFSRGNFRVVMKTTTPDLKPGSLEKHPSTGEYLIDGKWRWGVGHGPPYNNFSSFQAWWKGKPIKIDSSYRDLYNLRILGRALNNETVSLKTVAGKEELALRLYGADGAASYRVLITLRSDGTSSVKASAND